MLRRRFLTLFSGAAAGSPLQARAADEGHVWMLDQIHELRRQLADAQREKTQLLSTISEMRQPLAIVLGYTELMLDNGYGEISADVRIGLERIARGGERAVELINGVFAAVLAKRNA